MCNDACHTFARQELSAGVIRGRDVLEVGALDVNGSVRDIVLSLGPASYVGVDQASGPGVDRLCRVERLTDAFGRAAFDVVVSTEMLEHVRRWRAAVSQMKEVLREHGLLLLTTRSPGFPYHGYPEDYWRFDLEDLRRIFRDFAILRLEPDPSQPGVFLLARKLGRGPCALEDVTPHCILTGRREKEVPLAALGLLRIRGAAARCARTILPRRVRDALRPAARRAGWTP